MTEPQLPPPPRELQPGLRRQLTFGVPSLLLAQILSFCVLLAIFLLFLIYGVGLQRYLASRGKNVSVESQISEVKMLNLPSGERVPCVVAPVVVNEQQLDVLGFGEKTQEAQVGDPVTILIPAAQPKFARLETFQSRPIKVGALLGISLLFWIPSVVLVLVSLHRSKRRLKLLQHGQEIQGKVVRKIPLPRPLKDHVLARWQIESEKGKTRQFWSLQKSDLEKPVLLRVGEHAGLLERLLPDYHIEQGQLTHSAKLPQAYLLLNGLLLISQLVLLFGFCLT